MHFDQKVLLIQAYEILQLKVLELIYLKRVHRELRHQFPRLGLLLEVDSVKGLWVHLLLDAFVNLHALQLEEREKWKVNR